MSAGFLERLAFGRAAERGEAAIAARSAGLPAIRVARDFGAEAAEQAALVEGLFGLRPAPRPDPDFRRHLEARLLDAVGALPRTVDRPAPTASALVLDPGRNWRPMGYLRPLLVGASSLALAALLFLRPSAISSELAAPPTALAATAEPRGGPTGTFTPEARATEDTRHAQGPAGGGSPGS